MAKAELDAEEYITSDSSYTATLGDCKAFWADVQELESLFSK